MLGRSVGGMVAADLLAIPGAKEAGLRPLYTSGLLASIDGRLQWKWGTQHKHDGISSGFISFMSARHLSRSARCTFAWVSWDGSDKRDDLDRHWGPLGIHEKLARLSTIVISTSEGDLISLHPHFIGDGAFNKEAMGRAEHYNERPLLKHLIKYKDILSEKHSCKERELGDVRVKGELAELMYLVVKVCEFQTKQKQTRKRSRNSQSTPRQLTGHARCR